MCMLVYDQRTKWSYKKDLKDRLLGKFGLKVEAGELFSFFSNWNRRKNRFYPDSMLCSSEIVLI